VCRSERKRILYSCVLFVVDEFRRVHVRKDVLRVQVVLQPEVKCCSVRCVTDNKDVDMDRLR
jgi:hypothetical protein